MWAKDNIIKVNSFSANEILSYICRTDVSILLLLSNIFTVHTQGKKLYKWFQPLKPGGGNLGEAISEFCLPYILCPKIESRVHETSLAFYFLET